MVKIMKIKSLNELMLEKSCYPLSENYKKFIIEQDYSAKSLEECAKYAESAHWIKLADSMLSSLFLPNLEVFEVYLKSFIVKDVPENLRNEIYKDIFCVAVMQHNKPITPVVISIFMEYTGINPLNFLYENQLKSYSTDNISNSPLLTLKDSLELDVFDALVKAYKDTSDIKDVFYALNHFPETTEMAEVLLGDFDCVKFLYAINENKCDFYCHEQYLLIYLLLSEKKQWKTSQALESINFQSYYSLSLFDSHLIIDNELSFLSKLSKSFVNDSDLMIPLAFIDFSADEDSLLDQVSRYFQDSGDLYSMHSCIVKIITILSLRKRNGRIQEIVDSWLNGDGWLNGDSFPKVYPDKLDDFLNIAKFLKAIHVKFDVDKYEKLVKANLVFPSFKGLV